MNLSGIKSIILAVLPKDPLIGVLIGGVWKLVSSLDGRSKEKREGQGRVIIRHYKPWALQMWHQRPFSIAQAYDISFSLALGNYSATLQEAMEYKVKVTGRTGKARFWRIDLVEEMNSELKFKIVWS